ncbi:MAG: substrate-binding and VWA domain-containing protein, partial [Bifidobacteriaceae bacterium]|nr:substrate-binding and VWA domain-containing protein [Bifidobacteriaceae bacterium]
SGLGTDSEDPDIGGWGDIRDDGCTPLVVATSSEKVNLMDELGEAFKDSEQGQGLAQCATVYPINVTSGKASEILSARPDEWPIGAQEQWPAIWSPASTIWTDRVVSLAGGGFVDGAESFAKTPVVFAMPEAMARALGWPDQEIGIKDFEALVQAGGWASVDKPLWGAFKLSKTNPNTSTTGLSTILMQAYAASGKSEGLTADDVAAAAQFSQVFESAAIHYGDTTGKVLQSLADSLDRGEANYVSAVALEETSLYNYNLGNPDSHTVQPGETLTPPKEKLVAVYPSEGSMWSDNPAVVLRADWVTAEQTTAAEAFLSFLHTTTAQQILPKYGFRPVDASVDASGTLNAEVGIDTAKPAVTLEKPAEAVVTAALEQWTQIRKPSAVLEVIDISGSMDESIGDGRTRLEAAIEGAKSTVDNFRPTDEIGVWAFTTGLVGVFDGVERDNVVAVREFGPLGDGKESLRNDIADLAHSTRRGTPLYDTLELAYTYMSQRAEAGRINAIVVLSDGEDTDSLSSIDSLLQQINQDNAEGGNDAPVRIFAIAYSDSADVDALARLAQASGGQVFDATDATKISEVFRSVMNNF